MQLAKMWSTCTVLFVPRMYISMAQNILKSKEICQSGAVQVEHNLLTVELKLKLDASMEA